jgi:hypothetical protein
MRFLHRKVIALLVKVLRTGHFSLENHGEEKKKQLSRQASDTFKTRTNLFDILHGDARRRGQLCTFHNRPGVHL